jgi:hypothetical protein
VAHTKPCVVVCRPVALALQLTRCGFQPFVSERRLRDSKGLLPAVKKNPSWHQMSRPKHLCVLIRRECSGSEIADALFGAVVLVMTLLRGLDAQLLLQRGVNAAWVRRQSARESPGVDW